MAKRQRDPAKEAFWRDMLERFAASGLGVRAFCERQRLSEASFYGKRPVRPVLCGLLAWSRGGARHREA